MLTDIDLHCTSRADLLRLLDLAKRAGCDADADALHGELVSRGEYGYSWGTYAHQMER